jgi:ABC-type sugar transport system ATPase subunit
MHKFSTKWHWKERVAAWDDLCYKTKLRATLKAFEKTTADQVKALSVARNLGSKRMNRLKKSAKENEERIEDMSLETALRYLETAVKNERLIFGAATERIEERMRRDAPPSGGIDLSELNEEELKMLESIMPLLSKIGLLESD